MTRVVDTKEAPGGENSQAASSRALVVVCGVPQGWCSAVGQGHPCLLVLCHNSELPPDSAALGGSLGLKNSVKCLRTF